ncbi:MAG: hypothetical protein ACK505_10265, partial [Flavobacteriales bacterium]
MNKNYSFGRTCWLKFALPLLALFVSVSGWAQINAYSFNTDAAGVLDPMTGATTLLSASSDDGASSVTNIGFNFDFNGVTYTQFSANVNGLVRFGPTAVTTAFSNSTTS